MEFELDKKREEEVKRCVESLEIIGLEGMIRLKRSILLRDMIRNLWCVE